MHRKFTVRLLSYLNDYDIGVDFYEFYEVFNAHNSQ